MNGLEEEVRREKETLRGRAPSLRSPIAALRYLLRQGLLREDITLMAAKFAVAGMCSAMAEALEKEES